MEVLKPFRQRSNIGELKIDLAKYILTAISPDGDESLKRLFTEPVFMGSQICTEATGTLVLENVPRYSQLLGGKRISTGIIGGSVLRPLVERPHIPFFKNEQVAMEAATELDVDTPKTAPPERIFNDPKDDNGDDDGCKLIALADPMHIKISDNDLGASYVGLMDGHFSSFLNSL